MAKKKEIEVYTVDSLENLNEADLFGLYCLTEVDWIVEIQTIAVYAEIFRKFKELGRGKIIQHLADKGINIDKESI